MITVQRILSVFLLAIALILVGCNGDVPDAESAQAVNDMQVIEIDVNADGYEPETIQLEEGVQTELVFTRHTDDPCVEEIEIPDFDVTAELPLGEPVSVEFTPDASGEFEFVCGMDMVGGTLVVES